MMPSCTSGVPSWSPCVSGRVQTSFSLRDVAPVDLIERAVAPVVERAPPHRPVGGIGIREHRVGDGREARDRSGRRRRGRRVGCRILGQQRGRAARGDAEHGSEISRCGSFVTPGSYRSRRILSSSPRAAAGSRRGRKRSLRARRRARRGARLRGRRRARTRATRRTAPASRTRIAGGPDEHARDQRRRRRCARRRRC